MRLKKGGAGGGGVSSESMEILAHITEECEIISKGKGIPFVSVLVGMIGGAN